jgi:hypothetical protein
MQHSVTSKKLSTTSKRSAELESPALTQWLAAHPALLQPLLTTLNSSYADLAGALVGSVQQAQAAVAAQTVGEKVASLCGQSAAEARAYVEENTKTPQLIRVAVHHGLLDLIYEFVTRNQPSSSSTSSASGPQPSSAQASTQSQVVAPAWKPTSAHRLSKDAATNAWLWLIKGDGDLDQKAWLAMVASDLLKSDADACDVIEGVYKSGAKVTTNAVLSGIEAGKSILETAVVNNKPSVVQCLLEVRGEASHRDAQGKSLMSKTTSARVARLLVVHGADIHAVNANGKETTTLDYAQSKSREVWSYLRAVQLSRSSIQIKPATDSVGTGSKSKAGTVASSNDDNNADKGKPLPKAPEPAPVRNPLPAAIAGLGVCKVPVLPEEKDMGTVGKHGRSN